MKLFFFMTVCFLSLSIAGKNYSSDTWTSPKANNLNNSEFFIQISAGNISDHTCGITNFDRLYCWGANDFGQIGTGNTNKIIKPELIELDFLQISVGGYHTCGINKKNTLYCWGSNEKGQIGTGEKIPYYSLPRLISKNYKYVASGDFFTCAINLSNDLNCWGANDFGQFGINTSNDIILKPKLIGSNYQTVSLGSYHSCGIRNTKMSCWGWNQSGQLGTKDQNKKKNHFLKFNSLVTASGTHHNCTIDSNKTLYCWGSNFLGLLGIGTKINNQGEIHKIGSNYKTVSLSKNYTCAINMKNELSCWGANDDRFPINDLFVTTPYLFKGSYKAVTLGIKHICAITTNNELQCWGHNNQGQLGINNTRNQKTPQTIKLL